MALTTPDIIIIVILFISVVIGIFRGFIKESISLVTWAVAIFLALIFAKPLSVHMNFTQIEFIRLLTGFMIVFIGVVFTGALINYFIGAFIRKTPFSLPDRVLGTFFGVIRGGVVVTVLVLVAGLTQLPEQDWWKKSEFIPHFEKTALWLKKQLPEEYAKEIRLSNEERSEKSDSDTNSTDEV